MIEYFLNKIPRTDVSLEDFPYLEKYFNYVVYEISSNIKNKSLPVPKFHIKDSPFYESLFIEHNDGSDIVFDVGISLLTNEVNDILNYGIITRGSWVKLLEVAANFLTCNGFPGIGIAFALNKNWSRKTRLHSKVMANFSKNFFKDVGNKFSSDIRCQEMFLLTHEIIHYYAKQGIYNIENVHRFIFENIIKYRCGDFEVKIFFDKLIGKVNDKDEQIFYKKLRKIFLSESFKEEILCDLIATEMTIEYFIWDSHQYMKLPDVCASIQTTMRSLFLITSLRNQFLRSELPYHIWLRIKIIDKILSKILLTYRAPKSTENDYIDFNVLHSMNLKNRTALIEQFLFEDIKYIILQLQNFYKKIPFEIVDLKTTALYFLGFNTGEMEKKSFIENDLDILRKNKNILRAMKRSDRVDLYQISASSIKKAREMMRSV